ncbi:MAG: hypothetical protein KGH69_04675 [Candidatus Micrarchaeota archaeon]|nr:hypothetical protein [Candidatus Micrarchaeota archaeon]
MFRTEPMQKVRIVAIDHDKGNVIAELHRLRIIDLRKSRLSLEDDKPLQESQGIAEMLIRVNGALQILKPQPIGTERHIPFHDMEKEVRGSESLKRIYELSAERKQINDEQQLLSYAERVSSMFSGIRIDFSRLKSEFISYAAIEADSGALRRFMNGSKSLKRAEVIEKELGKGKHLIFIAYDRKLKIDELIKGKGFNEIDLTARYLEGMPEKAHRNAVNMISKNAERLKQIGKELDELSVRHYSRLVNLQEMLGIEQQRAEASSTFKRTERTFVMEGWIQKKKVQELESVIESVTKGRSYVELLKDDELAPTYTERPKFLQPFEYLVSFYSTQRSDEIDPTWIFILSFPIFYGMMVTDVGYGVASFLLTSLIIAKTDPEGLMNNVARIWRFMSIFAILFGFLSNQYFGFQLNHYIFNYQMFDWLKDAPAIIAITIMFGVTQVMLGLLLGFFNNWRRHHKKLAVSRLTSMVTMAFGIIAVSGAFFGAFHGPIVEYSAGIAIVALLATVVLSGQEATEIVNLITHPLSYARIMGFGLASIIIATLINQAFTPRLSDGIIVFVVYLIIFITLHLLNMILSIFEGMVQGVRLNFVEFFSKFYIGNGIKFRPFGYKRIHTKE